MGWFGDIWNLISSSRAIMSRSCWLPGSSMSLGLALVWLAGASVAPVVAQLAGT